MEPFEEKVRRGGAAAMEEVDRFFRKADPVHETLRNIATRLDDLRIPYTPSAVGCAWSAMVSTRQPSTSTS